MISKVILIDGTASSITAWYKLVSAGVPAVPVFVRTGNEHPDTMEYLDYLRNRIGDIRSIERDYSAELLKKKERVATVWAIEGHAHDRIEAALLALSPTDAPFLNMCLLVGRFPGWDVAFCDPELIYQPLREQVVRPLIDQGHDVIRYVHGESIGKARRNAIVGERIDLLPEDTAALTYLDRHGIAPHPAYLAGYAPRCGICFKDAKARIKQISQDEPATLTRIREWEKRVAAATMSGEASYFRSSKVPATHGDYRRVIPIMDIAEWSMTTKGGRNKDWIELVKGGLL